jgi:Uma2 family endonuclease
MHHRKQDDPRFTYGDYVQWQGDERWELIDGIAHLMSPAPSMAHQRVLMELARQIANQLEGQRCRLFPAPFDVRLPRTEEADDSVDTVVQPDLVVVCDPDKLDEAGVRGAPDWVIEILSPSTTARDRIEKRDLYERTGVREYWIVHPTEATATNWHREGDRFGIRFDGDVAGETAAVSVPGVTIDWSLVFRKRP